jgi:hypothetical protein
VTTLSAASIRATVYGVVKSTTLTLNP